MSKLSSTGKLPETQKRFENAVSVFYNVDNMESRHTVARDARTAIKSKEHVVYASLDDTLSKLESLMDVSAEISETGDVVMSSRKSRRRVRALENARVLVVQVSPDEIESLDSVIATSIDHPKVHSTILAGIRSTEEVKHARKLIKVERRRGGGRRRRRRRRLDEQVDDEEAQDDDAYDTNRDVAYVYCTPNILAGILYMLFFTATALVGISCMTDIQGQDVYVSKYPAIGLEQN